MSRWMKLEALLPLRRGNGDIELEILADDGGLQVNVHRDGVCEARVNLHIGAGGSLFISTKEHLTERIIIPETEIIE